MLRKVAILGAGAVGSYVIWTFGQRRNRTWNYC